MANNSDDKRPMTLVQVLEKIQSREDDDDDELDVGEVLSAFGPRSYGPLLLVPALISVLPGIGALPGISWGAAALVVLISVQFVFNRDKLWLPGPLRNAAIPRDSFDKAVNRFKPWLARVDRLFEPRLQQLLNPASAWLVSLVCLAMGFAMFAFSIIPGGIMIPGMAVVLLSLGLTSHDGFVVLLGLAAALATGAGLIWFFVL